MSKAKSLLKYAIAELKPKELKPSKWAEAHRVVNYGAFKGRWRNDKTPYLVDFMDDARPDNRDITHIVYLKASQMGMTEALINLILYLIDQHPTEMAYYMPTDDLIKEHSENKLTPAINSCEKILKLMVDEKSRQGTRTLKKVFIGGFLELLGVESLRKLSNKSFMYLFIDELSRMKDHSNTEGDTLDLIASRGQTYGDRMKLIAISTPTNLGTCKIWEQYLQTDQRKYFFKCPCCGKDTTLEPENSFVLFDKESYKILSDLYVKCTECNYLINEKEKREILFSKKAKWIATATPQNVKKRGYYINAFYSYFIKWEDIKYKIVDAIREYDIAQKTSKLKVLYNHTYALPFDEKQFLTTTNKQIEKLKSVNIHGYNTTHISSDININFITAGADIQHDRIECCVVGWDIDTYESYILDYYVTYGDTIRSDDPYEELDNLLFKAYKINDQDMFCEMTALDVSDGTTETRALNFIERIGNRGIIPVRGASYNFQALWKQTKGDSAYHLNVNSLKDIIYRRFELRNFGDGFIHVPKKEPFILENWQKGVFSEVKEKNKYVKIYKRNEPLDTLVYAYGALEIYKGVT